MTLLSFYALACLTFVFLAMVEYAVILFMIRREQLRKLATKVEDSNGDENEPERIDSAASGHSENETSKKTKGGGAEKSWFIIDMIALGLFSITFLIFNIVVLSNK